MKTHAKFSRGLRWFTGALALGGGIAASTWGQEESWSDEPMGEAYGDVVVSGARVSDSFRVQPTGLRLIETEAVRAASEVVIRLAGWRPWRAPVDQPPTDQLTPDSPEAWRTYHEDCFGLRVELVTASQIQLTPYLVDYGEGGLTSLSSEPPLPGWNLSAPSERGETMTFDLSTASPRTVWTGVAAWAGVPDAWLQRFTWPDQDVPGWVVRADVINLPWIQRWSRLSSARKAAFTDIADDDAPPAEALVEWTRLALVQGVFNARLEPMVAARWFGQVWLGAALIETANPGHAGALAVANELRALVRRYGAREWGDDVPVSRWLPEMRIAWNYDQRAFVAGEAYPPIEGPFDYLIRLESYLLHPETNEARAAFLQEGTMEALDRLLLGFKDNARIFESNQAIYNLGTQLFRQNRVTLVGYALSQLDTALELDPVEPNEVDERAFEVVMGTGDSLAWTWATDQNADAENLWLALDQDGTKGFDYESAPRIRDTALAMQLVILRQLENALKARTPVYDPEWTYSWADAWPEVRGWMLRLSWSWRGRLKQIGADAAVREADLIWQRAGFTMAEPLPGGTTARPNAQWQDGFEQAWRTMRRDLFTGRAAAAADALVPLLESTDQESRDLLVLGLHLGMAAGRGDEFMERVSERFRSGFGKDTLKQYLLSYRQDAAERFEGFIRPPNTNSANDYLARAEWAVRKGDWAQVLEICDAFHYGEINAISVLRLASHWWIDGEIAPPDLEALRGQLLALMESRFRSALDGFDFWYASFEQRFGDDPAWASLKEETRFEQVAVASRALKRLREPMTEQELDALARSMQAISALFKPETYTRGWQGGVVEAQQWARGRWVVDATQQFTVRLDEAARLIGDMVRRHRPLAKARSIYNLSYPLEGTWVRAAIAAGAEPEALAAWLASIPEDEAWWTRESVLWREVIKQPEVCAEVLRRQTYGESEGDVRVPALSISPSLVAEVARERQAWTLVGWAAVVALVEQDDFIPVATCFADGEQVRGWIDRNAANYDQRSKWLEAWAKTRTDAATEQAIPVPELSALLTRSETTDK